MNLHRILIIIASLILIAGCATSNIIPVGPETYMVTSSGAGFSSAGVRETVFEKANTFCTEKGLVMIPVSFKAEEGRPGRSVPNASLTFRALRSGDQAIQRPDIIEADENIHVTQDISIKEKNVAKKADVYTELLKLDDLKKRGILSETEFEKQKAKLLQ